MEASNLLPVLCLFTGIIIQCISLLRGKPPKWTIVIFAGMSLYMGAMMYYAVQEGHSNSEALSLQDLMPQILSFAMAVAFIFIAVFLKSIVENINEAVIVSTTVSFWLLVFESLSLVGEVLLIFFAGIGIVFSVKTFRLIVSEKTIGNVEKYILYGWYLFANGFFALSYFSSMFDNGVSFVLNVTRGDITNFQFFLTGMIIVHILFNFGILYYSIIYSLLSSDTRKGLVQYSENIFENSQIKRKDALWIGGLQLILYIILELLIPDKNYPFIVLWLLLAPSLVRIYGYFLKGKLLS